MPASCCQSLRARLTFDVPFTSLPASAPLSFEMQPALWSRKRSPGDLRNPGKLGLGKHPCTNCSRTILLFVWESLTRSVGVMQYPNRVAAGVILEATSRRGLEALPEASSPRLAWARFIAAPFPAPASRGRHLRSRLLPLFPGGCIPSRRIRPPPPTPGPASQAPPSLGPAGG